MVNKKCLVVTFIVDNFGACLQALALQNRLLEMGCDVNILNYSNRYQSDENLWTVRKIMQFSPRRLIQIALLRKESRKRKIRFNEFRASYLKLTDEYYYRDSDYTNLAGRYELFVCGSDMIWAEDFIEDWPIFYLSFAKSKQCMGYAPSFGKNMISKSNSQECARLLSDISFLSCREAAGCRLIQQLSGRDDVYHVIDPTLLYNGDEWKQILHIENPIVAGSYVLVYVFGGIKGYRKDFFRRVKQKERIVYIPMGFDEFKSFNACRQAIGPVEFVNLFSNAEAVITDTYHGMLFSIIFEKPFYVLKRKDKSTWAKQDDRMKDMLEQLGISERFIDETADLGNFRKMDYKVIKEKLRNLKTESIEYISGALRTIFLE